MQGKHRESKRRGHHRNPRKNLKKYADKNGCELVKIFKDNGISGASELENRPGLAELFSDAENNKEIEEVLIFKLDRLARDLYIQEHLIKKQKVFI